MTDSLHRRPLSLTGALVRVGLFWALSVGVLIAAGAAAHGLGAAPAGLFTGAMASLGTLLLSLAFLRQEARPPGAAGLAPDRFTPLRFLLGLAAGLVLLAVHMALVAAYGHVHWMRAPTPPLPWQALLTMVGYVALAWREELAFRGYPLRALAAAGGPWMAQIIMAGLFVVEHRLAGNNWSDAIVGAGLGALVFGAAALSSRGLALPLGLHAAWNIGDWMRGNKGGGYWVASVDPGYAAAVEHFGLMAYALVMVMALLLFEWWRRAKAMAER